MGYRNYIYSFDKDFINDLRKSNTEEDVITFAQKYNYINEDKDFWLPNAGKCLHEFGKYYFLSGEIYDQAENLFTSEELKEQYEELSPVIITKDIFKFIITETGKRVFQIYEDLNKEEDIDGISQINRLKAHVHDYFLWWKLGPGDLSGESKSITSSWLYEHIYFELIRIYKSYDWRKNVMVFLGY